MTGALALPPANEIELVSPNPLAIGQPQALAVVLKQPAVVMEVRLNGVPQPFAAINPVTVALTSPALAAGTATMQVDLSTGETLSRQVPVGVWVTTASVLRKVASLVERNTANPGPAQAGFLAHGHGTSIRQKLVAAAAALDGGNVAAARGAVGAAWSEVQALVASGKIAPVWPLFIEPLPICVACPTVCGLAGLGLEARAVNVFRAAPPEQKLCVRGSFGLYTAAGEQCPPPEPGQEPPPAPTVAINEKLEIELVIVCGGVSTAIRRQLATKSSAMGLAPGCDPVFESVSIPETCADPSVVDEEGADNFDIPDGCSISLDMNVYRTFHIFFTVAITCPGGGTKSATARATVRPDGYGDWPSPTPGRPNPWHPTQPVPW